MTEAPSFYPPRARWYSPLLIVGGRIRRRLALDFIQLPAGVSPGGALACLLFPGTAFYVCGPRFWGKVAIGLSVLLFFVQVAWFGSGAASVAFGLLLSVHASGLAFFVEKMLPAPGFRSRLISGAGLLALLAFFLYLPARKMVQSHWFFPLQVNDRVVVIYRQHPTINLRRGEPVAYSLDGFSEHGLVVRSGFGFGPLLGLPGDQVRFNPDSFEVNGLAHQRLAFMPTSGELLVPQRHWFVWPEFGKHGNGHASDDVLSQTVLELSTISEAQFMGKPLRHWLWRRQF